MNTTFKQQGGNMLKRNQSQRGDIVFGIVIGIMVLFSMLSVAAEKSDPKVGNTIPTAVVQGVEK